MRDKIDTLTVIPLTNKKKTDISGCGSLVPVRDNQPTATGFREAVSRECGDDPYCEASTFGSQNKRSIVEHEDKW